MKYIGIDPGLDKSAFVVTEEYMPIDCGILSNPLMRGQLINSNITNGFPGQLIIEKPICQKYAGSDVGETIRWAGIFQSAWPEWENVVLLTRSKVRMCTVGRKATDSRIRKWLIERFESGYSAETSQWFKGFKEDIWQAYALLVTYLDQIKGVKWIMPT